jgi:putative transposase
MVFADKLNKNVEILKNIEESKVIGIDIGLTNIMVDSNSKKEINPRFLKNATRNLRIKQKKLSRKQKGSKARYKSRLLVAKCHERVRNIRNDFQHKISKAIIDENQAIIVETLKVKNMLKNRKLSKHISDASWSSLLTKLEYKAHDAGKHFRKINQWFASSKICSVCGYKVDNMSLEIRKWQCIDCQTEHERDINAAINIKQQGLMLLKAEGLSVSAN